MIDFEMSPQIENARTMIHMMAEQTMRPISREYDEREHEEPTEWHEMMWSVSKGSEVTFGGSKGDKKAKGPSERNLTSAITIEELSWGDAGLYLSIPNAGLGGAAVAAAGTPEQRKRFLARFQEGKPKWAAMAITEPGCGSDSAAITTTAVRDGDQWVLNGTKIFCTSGQRALDESDGFVVVWATVDKSAGRAGIKAFVVEAGTPGITVTKVEDKLGIRASDTAQLVLEFPGRMAKIFLTWAGRARENRIRFIGEGGTIEWRGGLLTLEQAKHTTAFDHTAELRKESYATWFADLFASFAGAMDTGDLEPLNDIARVADLLGMAYSSLRSGVGLAVMA